MKSTELRPGNAVRIDGNMYIITQFQHITPGNWRAMVNLRLKNVQTGLVMEKRFRSGEDIEQIDLDRREMEYLYTDSTGHVFMDNVTYDQITLSDDFLGGAMQYMKPNTVANVLVCEGKPLTIELPATVDLIITETTPAIKGATATNQLKEATLETGLKTRVPPFIGEGELVRISTADGSYQSRAKE